MSSSCGLLLVLLPLVNIDADEYFCCVSKRIRLRGSPFCSVHVCFVEKADEEIWWSLGIGASASGKSIGRFFFSVLDKNLEVCCFIPKHDLFSFSDNIKTWRRYRYVFFSISNFKGKSILFNQYLNFLTLKPIHFDKEAGFLLNSMTGIIFYINHTWNNRQMYFCYPETCI